MRLVQVQQFVRAMTTYQAICLECRKRVPIDTLLADLDGEPFVAYYHPECVPEESEEPNDS